MYTEADLDAEENRRKYCITNLRHNDMGEQATNALMSQLSENPELLEPPEGSDVTPNSTPFGIKEFSQRGFISLQTRVGSLQMSDIMAARLRSLYVTHQPVDLLTPEYLSNFSRAAFLLLYRYSYVDPGFSRQGYLGPGGFEGIRKAFGIPIDLECLSSAFNTTVPRYCSLFPDVEGPFGSLGSFFDVEDPRDMRLIQVSPPRVGSITTQAVNHSIRLVSLSRRGLAAVLLTPLAWPDVTRLIESSGFLVWQNRVRQGDKIEYHDVVQNRPTLFPRPLVSVLSQTPVSEATSRHLHAIFSRR